MVRGASMAGPPAVKSKRGNVRRRIDVSLNVPGAEVRLPALPVIQVGWRLVSFMLAVILAGALYFAWTSPLLRVEKAEVSGLQSLSQTTVNAVLDVGDQPIFALDPDKMKTKLVETFPELISAEVMVKLPNTVAVKVVERTPILIWRQDGKSLLVDADGYAFPLLDSASSQPKLIVEAASPPPAEMAPLDITLEPVRFMPVEMVSGILSMSGVVPADTPILYDEAHGLGWVDKRGWEVYFGDTRDIDMKLKMYTAIVKKLKAEKIEPALISVEYVHAPYYRLER
jgi:cell division protein FtsQ